MPMKAYDSADPTTPAALAVAKRSGVGAWIRYLDPGLWDNATKAELARIHAAGLGIGLVSETNPTSALYFTAEQGTVDGRASRDYAKKAGVPKPVHLYRPVDYDALGGDLTRVGDYATAYAHTVGKARAGLYGGYEVMEYVRKHGIIRNRWQTYGWSDDRVSPGISWYQHQNGVHVGGLTADEDLIYDASGLWMPAGVTKGGTAVATLQNGDSGAAVKTLQEHLKAVLGLDAKFVLDGDFGPQTEAAVQSFQVQAKLSVDGIVGPNTQAALDAAYTKVTAQKASTPAPAQAPVTTTAPVTVDLKTAAANLQTQLEAQVAQAEADKAAAEAATAKAQKDAADAEAAQKTAQAEADRVVGLVNQAVDILKGVNKS